MIVDEDVQAFLEHHGVKGQKWGVRRTARVQGHLDRVSRVASGTATRAERVRVALASGGIVTKKGAGRALRRGAAAQKAIKDGDAFVLDFLTRAQGLRVRDLNYHQGP